MLRVLLGTLPQQPGCDLAVVVRLEAPHSWPEVVLRDVSAAAKEWDDGLESRLNLNEKTDILQANSANARNMGCTWLAKTLPLCRQWHSPKPSQ
jgi:hypothetical protein